MLDKVGDGMIDVVSTVMRVVNSAKINLNPKMFIEQLISSSVNSLCRLKHGSLEKNEKDD